MIAKLLLAKSGGGAGAQEEPGGVPNPRVDSVALAKKRLARQHAAEPGGQAREAHVEVDEEEDSAGPLEESASSDLKLPCKTDSILLARTRIDKKHQAPEASRLQATATGDADADDDASNNGEEAAAGGSQSGGASPRSIRFRRASASETESTGTGLLAFLKKRFPTLGDQQHHHQYHPEHQPAQPALKGAAAYGRASYSGGSGGSHQRMSMDAGGSGGGGMWPFNRWSARRKSCDVPSGATPPATSSALPRFTAVPEHAAVKQTQQEQEQQQQGAGQGQGGGAGTSPGGLKPALSMGRTKSGGSGGGKDTDGSVKGSVRWSMDGVGAEPPAAAAASPPADAAAPQTAAAATAPA